MKAKKATEVSVTRQTVSSITVGKNKYDIVKTADGVNVSNGQGTLFVPNGAVGKAIADEIATLTHVVQSRKRRTKAEMAASEASAEAQATESATEGTDPNQA